MTRPLWYAAAGTAAGLAAVVWLLKRQRSAAIRRCGSYAPLTGKLALVTGASSGLGKRLALELALRGASVILAGRNKALVERATADVKAALVKAKTPAFSLSQAIFDLNSLASVKEFAKQFRGRYDKLDLLVNNAGIMSGPERLTENALESHFQVNHLSHFVLTQELLPALLAAEGRVVNVSSGYHKRVAAIDWAYLDHSPIPNYNQLFPYKHSKLAQVLFALEMAKRQPTITSVSCCPGFVRGTELGRHHPTFLRLLGYPLIWYFSRSVDEGVQNLLHCSTAPGLTNGAYYANCAEDEQMPLVTEAAAAELWELSERLVAEALGGKRYKTTKGTIAKRNVHE